MYILKFDVSSRANRICLNKLIQIQETIRERMKAMKSTGMEM